MTPQQLRLLEANFNCAAYIRARDGLAANDAYKLALVLLTDAVKTEGIEVVFRKNDKTPARVEATILRLPGRR